MKNKWKYIAEGNELPDGKFDRRFQQIADRLRHYSPVVKTMAAADKGLAAWATGFAAGGLARRGIEPALPLAYAVLAIETIGALLIMLGLFTRLAAAAAAIEFALITFAAHWANGFGFSSPGGGWEYPLFWGLILFAIALRGGGPYSLDRKLGWEL